ncbi:DUF4167 domain-containing protein [Candidatus Liberibacter solanacearum]|uniref:DUF4167 domain-containing protein n=1 Tax=Candidatus Liberibacter solanacearum TaxID=556287 RepID=UPI00387149AE
MRSGQQYKRSRGRGSSGSNGNFGRKNLNPLVRNYDSNGYDVKVRGTAQHIAERYSALARDAISAGDYVVAENHFQHAEHYNRIVSIAQAQIQEKLQRDEQENLLSKESRGRVQNAPSGFEDDSTIKEQKEPLFSSDIQPAVGDEVFKAPEPSLEKKAPNKKVYRRRVVRPRVFHNNKINNKPAEETKNSVLIQSQEVNSETVDKDFTL